MKSKEKIYVDASQPAVLVHAERSGDAAGFISFIEYRCLSLLSFDYVI
jgi:hypothetical protein